MNKLLFIFLLLLNFSAISQKQLERTFRRGHTFEGKGFTFLKDGTFEYFDYGCLYSIKGKGKYTIKRDKLKLTFIGNKQLESSSVIKNLNCKNLSSNRITITVIDKETKKPIPNINVKLMLKYTQRTIKYSQMNENGTFVISGNIFDEFRDSSFVVTVNYQDHNYIPGETFQFDFKLNSCKKIDIASVKWPDSHNQKVYGGTVWKYRIKKFKEEYSEGIVLQKVTNFMKPQQDEEVFLKKGIDY